MKWANVSVQREIQTKISNRPTLVILYLRRSVGIGLYRSAQTTNTARKLRGLPFKQRKRKTLEKPISFNMLPSVYTTA